MDYDGSAIEECIRFNSVTFIYDKSKPVDSDHEVEESGAPVLNNLNLSVRKGCKVALSKPAGVVKARC
jgi:ABC-type multidrug transport system fused ATPase/permease subunit